ncbi:MAG: ABC transporter ATP-binding protein [Zestosphaera sp.]
MLSNNAIVSLKDVIAGYPTTGKGLRSLFKYVNVVLKNINLKIYDGERVAIIGESGSGKTTLLKVILGLLKPVRGEVEVLGKEIYEFSWSERVRILRQIGYVPQDPYKALNPKLRVKTIISEPLESMRVKPEEIEERVREVARMVQLSDKILDKYPGELSGGMMQRVLIARSIIHDPEILILDEPTSALDVSIQAQIIELINNIHKRLELAILTVTHDLGVAQYLSDRAIILYKGNIVEEGYIDDIITKPRHEYTSLLIASYKASI